MTGLMVGEVLAVLALVVAIAAGMRQSVRVNAQLRMEYMAEQRARATRTVRLVAVEVAPLVEAAPVVETGPALAAIDPAHQGDDGAVSGVAA